MCSFNNTFRRRKRNYRQTHPPNHKKTNPPRSHFAFSPAASVKRPRTRSFRRAKGPRVNRSRAVARSCPPAHVCLKDAKSRVVIALARRHFSSLVWASSSKEAGNSCPPPPGALADIKGSDGEMGYTIRLCFPVKITGDAATPASAEQQQRRNNSFAPERLARLI